MSKLRVCFVGYQWPPDSGGAPQFNSDLCGELGKSVDLVVLRAGVELVDFLKVRGATWRNCFKVLKFAGRRFDVVVASEFSAGPVAWLLSVLTGARYVQTLLGNDVIDLFVHYRFVARFLLWRAFRIHCISKATLRLLEDRMPGVCGKVVVLNPGVVVPGELVYQVEDEFRLLTLAWCLRKKGQHLVIRMLPELLKFFPGLTYYVVGRGDDLPFFKSEALRLGVSDKVHFLGFVEHKWDEFAKCAVFIQPSEYSGGVSFEGFGMTFLEAGFFGKPVITMSGFGSEDAVRDGMTGFVCKDEVDLLEKTKLLLSDKDLRRRMGEANRKYVLEECLWEKKIEEYKKKILVI